MAVGKAGGGHCIPSRQRVLEHAKKDDQEWGTEEGNRRDHLMKSSPIICSQIHTLSSGQWDGGGQELRNFLNREETYCGLLFPFWTVWTRDSRQLA